MIINHLSFALMIALCVSVPTLAQQLVGTVQDRNGKPLRDVLVYSYPTRMPKPSELAPYQYTDKRGAFRFQHYGKVVFIIHRGFRPIVQVVSGPSNQLKIVLDDAKETEWVVPACKMITNEDRYIGNSIKLKVPSNLGLLEEKSPDAVRKTILYKAGNKQQQLTIWASVSGGDLPAESLILSSTMLTTRALRSGRDYGVEFRGELAGKQYWRHSSFGFYTFAYQDVSIEAAKFFDNIIDSLCVEPASALSR